MLHLLKRPVFKLLTLVVVANSMCIKVKPLEMLSPFAIPPLLDRTTKLSVNFLLL